MERRPPAVVATVQECRIPIQQVANALDIMQDYDIVELPLDGSPPRPLRC